MSTRTPSCLQDIVDSTSGTKSCSRAAIETEASMGCGLTPQATPTATLPSAVSLTIPLISSLGVSKIASANAAVVRTAAIPAATRARYCHRSTALDSFDARSSAAYTNASADCWVACAFASRKGEETATRRSRQLPATKQAQLHRQVVYRAAYGLDLRTLRQRRALLRSHWRRRSRPVLCCEPRRRPRVRAGNRR